MPHYIDVNIVQTDSQHSKATKNIQDAQLSPRTTNKKVQVPTAVASACVYN